MRWTKRMASVLKLLLDVVLCRGDIAEVVAQSQPIPFVSLFRYGQRSDVIRVVAGCGCALLGGLIQPLVLIIGSTIVTLFLNPESKFHNESFWDSIKHRLIIYAAVGFVAFFFSFWQTYLLRNASGNICRRIKQEFLAAILCHDASFFDVTNSGAITSQLNNNVEQIQDGIGDKIGMILRGFSMFISSIIYCLFLDWRLTLIAMTMGPLSAIILGLQGKLVSSTVNESMEISSMAAETLEESVMNVKTVASCNAQEHMTQKYRKVLLSGMKPARRFWLWSGLFEGFSLFTILSIFGVTLWIGVQEYNDGTIASGGNVVAVVSTISLTAYYLGLLGPHMTSIVTARVAAAIVYRVIDEKTGRDDDGKVELTALDSIAFEQVVFKYPTREQPILKGLSWKAEKGESIAFVGHSGCGKSTSASAMSPYNAGKNIQISLIAKLYPPNSGRILVNGYPIDAVKTKSLRQMIGIVEQEPLLFNGTILENIRVGRDDVSEEAAKSAANTALADAFISQLSEGYNTVLGAHGVQLSGGQKQRIAIARAIAADPKVLLLDEATSALDTQSEKIVQEALDKASAGRTTITIAHRLSTLRNVDRIYVLDGGSVIEIGMHTELIEKGGFYANLAKAQEIEQNFLPEPEVSAGLSKSVHQMSGKNRPPSNKKPAAPSTRRKVATADDEEFPEKKRKRNVQSGFRLIYGNMHGFYDKVALTLVFTAVRALELPMLGLGTTFTVFAMEDRTKSDLYAGLALAICVIAGVATWFSAALTHMLSGDIAEGVTINLRTRAIRSLLYRPLPSFDRKSTASCVATIIQHAPKCTGAMNFNIVGILSLWISALLSISISFFFCWPLALLGVGLCVLISILISVNIVFGNRSRISKEKKDHSAEYAVEVVERVRTIQLLTTENWFIHRFAQQQQSAVKFEERVNLVEALNQALSNSCVFFTELSTYGLASYFLYTGYTNMHRAFIGLSGSQFAGWSIMYSAPYYPDVISAFSSAKQLFDIIDDDDVIQHVVHNGTSPEVKGSVLLANVDFAYPSRPNQLVARNLNLHANVGQSIALVGPSGCGKSTTINLLEAFYQTTHGDVMIDDIEISTINVLHLRRNIALVGQEPVLFRGTIVENITLGTEGITMEDVLKACQTANAANFIEAFPQGYETDVGEGGRALSGGQKQRVAIARALIRRPEIILLDEATSALDTESEKVVQRALNDASVGRTSITVAHRLSSIQHCDRIFVIEKGAVVEYGSHGELLALGGHYARLVQAQSLSN